MINHDEKYYLWMCGTWCEESEMEDYLKFMSDDAMHITEKTDIEEIISWLGTKQLAEVFLEEAAIGVKL